MKQKKRLLSLVLAMMMAFSLMVPTYAVGSEIQDESYEDFTAEEVVLLCNQLFPDDPNPVTLEYVQRAMDVLEEVNDSGVLQDDAITRTPRSSVGKVELATYLSSDDGVGSMDCSTIVSLMGDAKLESLLYSSDEDVQDSYRHFTWNYRAAREVGAEDTRIFTINYEYANVLLPVYENRYDQMLGATTNVTACHTAALAKTLAMRDVDINGGTRDDGDGTNVRVKSGMKNSRSEFDEYFREGGESTGKPDGFQDLWNNYYGRFYINNGYGSNYNAAYEAAVASGIVETGNTISTQKINTIYGNQSWWLV